jgi:hypothetical protein
MPDGPRPKGPDYDDDFYAWTQLPQQCPYTLDQILEEDWYPNPPGAKK